MSTARAGISAGDLVIAMNGHNTPSLANLQALGRAVPGAGAATTVAITG